MFSENVHSSAIRYISIGTVFEVLESNVINKCLGVKCFLSADNIEASDILVEGESLA